ncbi:DUF551 domain-containing protein [Photorhabdus akhurstii]|nr:DUF551 domain-containing protein [Photorhabdus akhurstii]
MNWISVDECVPKSSYLFERFIVATDKGIAIHDVINGFSGVIVSGNVQYSGYTITHWMPLPAPPTVEKDD